MKTRTEYMRNYRKANPEKIKAITAKYRDSEKGAQSRIKFAFNKLKRNKRTTEHERLLALEIYKSLEVLERCGWQIMVNEEELKKHKERMKLKNGK